MQTVTGLFVTNRAAHAAVSNLEEEGVPSSEISFIGRDREKTDAGEGAAAGPVLVLSLAAQVG